MKAVNLTLNLYSLNTEPVQAVQGDYDSIALSATFIDVDGSTLDMNEKTVSFKVLKSDNTEFSTDSVTISGNTATVVLSGQALTAKGTNYGEFRISMDGGIKKVPRFEIDVQASPELPDAQSQSELQELNEAIAKTENLPRIGDNGNWEVYSGTAYEDTGKPSAIQGPVGPDGPAGPAATISVGTVTTLPAGSQATAENVGTENAAVIDFGIPKGLDGEGGGITQDEADARYVQQTRTVNGKSLNTDITLTSDDVHARVDTWMPTAAEVGARSDTWTPTAFDVGLNRVVNATNTISTSAPSGGLDGDTWDVIQ